jgi:uncharacterized membrane protein YhaH (DUF805 family)
MQKDRKMIAELFDKLFDYNNRYNRSEFVWYQLLSALLFIALVSTVSLTYHWVKLLLPDNPTTVILPGLILFVGVIAYIYSNICIVIKRLHDMDLSGLLVLGIVVLDIFISGLLNSHWIAVVLFYTLLAACYMALALIPGTQGTNRYDDEDTTD